MPASPPATGHVTRAISKKAAVDSSPLAPEPVEFAPRGKKISPFDGWQRSKAGVGKSKKREGEVMERSGGMGKKAKSNGV